MAQELKNLIFRNEMNIAFFTVNGQPIDVPFEIKNGTLVAKTEEDEKTCIKLTMKHYAAIELDSYYHKVTKARCKKIPHKVFFELLEGLSSVLRREVELYEGSTKMIHPANYNTRNEATIKTCILPVYIMALASGKTFYNRYGFENFSFTQALKRYRDVTVSQLTTDASIPSNLTQMTLKEFAEWLKLECQTKSNFQEGETAAISKVLGVVRPLFAEFRTFRKPIPATPFRTSIKIEEKEDGVRWLVSLDAETVGGGKRKTRKRNV
jgi:hypothetical protein